MIKETLYTYLGTNGTITSPVHLEGIYSVKKTRLYAEENKLLTKDNKHFYRIIIVPENEVELWFEVESQDDLAK